MRRSLSIFMSVFMVIVALFIILDTGGARIENKIVSASDTGIEGDNYTAEENDYTAEENDYTAEDNDYRVEDNDYRVEDKGSRAPDEIDDEVRIVIKKTHQKLSLYRGDVEIKVYKAHFGEAGMEDKLVQGDRRTPEGEFYVTEKSILTPADEYLGSRWMRLSYPNIKDASRGLEEGIIDRVTHDSIIEAIENGQTPPQRTALGGGIGIHGGDVPEFGDNWTWGCIGLTNEDAVEIYSHVSVGTPVIIIN